MEKAISFLTSFFLSLFIISGAVMLALNLKAVYYSDIERLNISEKCGISTEEIKENYDAAVNYLKYGGTDVLLFPSFSVSEEGRIHFADVKRIFMFFKYSFYISFTLSVCLGVYLIKRKNFIFLRITASVTAFPPIILGIAVRLFPDSSFIAFHKIFFRNDYWIFDEKKDPIIKILPQEFFIHEAALIFVSVIIGSLICFIFYKTAVKRNRIR